MCQVSEKIRFCTCGEKEIEKLRNYWVLYRYDPKQEEYVIGEPVMPTRLRDPEFFFNQGILQKRLNEKDAFDFPVKFRNKDKFTLYLRYKDEDYSYSFIFKNGKWKSADEDPFDTMNHYEELKAGKCVSSYRRNTSVK